MKNRTMILHDRLKFDQLANIFISFTKSKGSFPCSQIPGPKLEHSPHWASINPILILSSHQHLGVFNDFVLSQVFRPNCVSPLQFPVVREHLNIQYDLHEPQRSQEGFNFFFTLSAWLEARQRLLYSLHSRSRTLTLQSYVASVLVSWLKRVWQGFQYC